MDVDYFYHAQFTQMLVQHWVLPKFTGFLLSNIHMREREREIIVIHKRTSHTSNIETLTQNATQRLLLKVGLTPELHDIIHIHNINMWDWQYSMELSPYYVLDAKNIMNNMFNPTKHCYGSENNVM